MKAACGTHGRSGIVTLIFVDMEMQNKDFLEAIIDFCYENNIPTVLTISHEKFDISDTVKMLSDLYKS